MVNVELLVVLVVSSFLVGVYRARMVSLILLLCFSVSSALNSLTCLQTDTQLVFANQFIIQPLIYVLFFISCIYFTKSKWEKQAVWSGLVLYIVLIISLSVYIPHLTELLIGHQHWMQEEVMVNLVLLMAAEYRKDESDKYAGLRFTIVVCMCIVVKLTQYTT